MDYDNLGDDANVKNKLVNFRESINEIENLVKLATNSNIYNDLDLKDKVNYDLFMTYTLNTLYWLYLKSINQNPNKNDVRNQLSRIKQYMLKRDQVSIQIVCNHILKDNASVHLEIM